jgi:hypothetical protein
MRFLAIIARWSFCRKCRSCRERGPYRPTAKASTVQVRQWRSLPLFDRNCRRQTSVCGAAVFGAMRHKEPRGAGDPTRSTATPTVDGTRWFSSPLSSFAPRGRWNRRFQHGTPCFTEGGCLGISPAFTPTTAGEQQQRGLLGILESGSGGNSGIPLGGRDPTPVPTPPKTHERSTARCA